jgi:hypothetical protein
MYKEDGIMWKSFMKDMQPDENPDQLIESISKAAEEFINSDEIYDRREIIDELKDIEKGDMVIMMGGPSTCKSLVLKDLFANNPKYLYLDGRLTDPNIISAIVDSIIERDNQNSLEDVVVDDIMPSMIFALMKLMGNKLSKKLSLLNILIKIAEVVTKNPMMAPKSLQLILKLIPNLEGIIFDEANEFFSAESLPLLKCLTSLTKQDRKLSVIMATSDYGFPFTLDKIGYNRNHILKSLVLSDVSPSDTLRLLSSWGVRQSLAYLLVEVYGGHLLQISRALVVLHRYKENAKINRSFIGGLSDQIIACISESKKIGVDRQIMIDLDTLMRTGFFACEFDDPLAALITKHNIAGFVGEQAVVPGLSEEVRRDRPGLVPTSQMIRIVYSLNIDKQMQGNGYN